jgi:hypothetical protein
MIGDYAGKRFMAQVRAVAFIVAYLLLVQLFLFRVPVEGAFGVALGIAAVAGGLAFFLEGLFLGIMPLGERCGLRLPSRAGLSAIALFALVIGVAATLAEPAIGFLRALGESVLPWEAPILFLLLNRGTAWLVAAIAAGVGVAVVLGVFRFIRGWRIKPFIMVLIPLLSAISLWAARDPRLTALIGLAWDAGGITTGPVTVPLVIALGVGLSRIAGGNDEAGGGLGVVTLASALPVLAVLLLGLALAPRVPAPGEASAFFAPANREAALFVMGAEAELEALGRKALDAGEFAASFATEAAGGEAAAKAEPEAPNSDFTAARGSGSIARKALADSLKAIIPLSLVLALVLRFLLREKMESGDEILLGIAFALVGMFLFGLGMDRGLGALGRQSGHAVPTLYAATERPDRALLLRGVDESMLLRVASAEGARSYLPVTTARPADGAGEASLIPWDPARHDAASGTYLHVPVEPPLLAALPAIWGKVAVLLFALVLGYGATLAEPSLAALGATLEDMTTGTWRSADLMRTVAAGVAAGMAAGFARILFDIPVLWILVPAYGAALLLTLLTADDFAAIAWDAAGVTTGPVTVPLVIATGLGIGERAGRAESFGILAAASVFPILALLLQGLFLQTRSRRSLRAGGGAA